jgi:hypothetical protein
MKYVFKVEDGSDQPVQLLAKSLAQSKIMARSIENAS